MEQLFDIGFKDIGTCKIENERLVFNIREEYKGFNDIKNVLYAFVEELDDADPEPVYIGQTRSTLRTRFSGYRNPGNDQQTNIKVNKGILDLLERGSCVKIYSFVDNGLLNWGGFHVNLAIGLEQSLIREFKPRFNAGNDKQAIGNQNEPEANDIIMEAGYQASWKIMLGKTYYYQGFINPGVNASGFLGDHGEVCRLVLHHENKHIQTLEAVIDRNANRNGSVRVYYGNQLATWYQENFNLGDSVDAYVDDNGVIHLDASS